MNIRSVVLDSIRWLFIAQILSQIIRMGVTIFVIRKLENEHMAYVAISLSFVGFLEMFSVLGLNTAIIARKEVTKRDLANISGLIISVNLFLALLVISLSGWIAAFYNTPELSDILKVLSIGFLLSAVGAIPGSMLVRQMRFREISAIQLISSFVGAVSSYILVINGFLYWSLILSGLVIFGVRVILILLISAEFVIPRFAFKESMDHITFGSRVMFGGIVWYLYTSLDVLIAGRMWTVELVGIYAVALQLVLMPMNRMLPILKQVALPAFSNALLEDERKLQSYLEKSVRVAMGICFPFYFGISCTATFIVPAVLGESWRDAALPLMCLSVAMPFRFYLELLSPAVMAAGYPSQLLYNNLIILVFMTSAFIAVTSFTSEPTYLAMVWTILFPILCYWASWRSCRRMGVDFLPVIFTMRGALVNSAVMWVLVWLFLKYAVGSLGLWLGLILAVPLGIFVYLAMMFCFDKGLYREYRGLMVSRAAG